MMDLPKSVYGYDLRDPVPTEHTFFEKNKHVGGYVADDGKIVINPYSSLKPHEKVAVARLEATRAYMNENNIVPDFDITPEQSSFFKKIDPDNYGKEGNEKYLKQSIVSRITVGDPTAGNFTPEQKAFADRIVTSMKNSVASRVYKPHLSSQFSNQEGGK
jgi:hypothetical protein